MQRRRGPPLPSQANSGAIGVPVGKVAQAPTGSGRRLGMARRPPAALVWAFVGYLALEYLRPPMLQAVKLQLLFILALPLFWVQSKERPWSRNLTLQTCFILAGLLMLPFAHNNYVVYLDARFMFGFLVTAIATTWLLAYRREFRRVVWIWVAIMCFQAFWAITHNGRGYGTYLGDENDLALACDMAFPFAFVGFQTLRGPRRWICGFAAVLLVCGVVASFSRGGFLGLAASGSYCVLSGRHRIRSIALGCAAAGIFYLAIPSDYKSEIESIREFDSGTGENRLFLWATAVNIWLDYPILGAGPLNSAYLMSEYTPAPTESGLFSGRQYTERIWAMRALHSIYFQVLAERGLVGCVLFGWLAVGHYAGLRRLRRELAASRPRQPALAREVHLYGLGLEAAMAGFLVAGAFLSMPTYPYFWFFSALAVALERAIRREGSRPNVTQGARPAA